MHWGLLIIVASVLAGCTTSGGSSGSTATTKVRESSQVNYVWSTAATEAANAALRPINDACVANGATALQIGACAHGKLLTVWPDTQAGAKDCAGIAGSRLTAACLLDFGYWTYISELTGRSPRGNWATFELNENDLFVSWFTKIHGTCDPAGDASDDVFYPCANREAKRLLSVDDEALKGCPEGKDPTLAVICYWDRSYNDYVLRQLERLGS